MKYLKLFESNKIESSLDYIQDVFQELIDDFNKYQYRKGVIENCNNTYTSSNHLPGIYCVQYILYDVPRDEVEDTSEKIIDYLDEINDRLEEIECECLFSFESYFSDGKLFKFHFLVANKSEIIRARFDKEDKIKNREDVKNLLIRF